MLRREAQGSAGTVQTQESPEKVPAQKKTTRQNGLQQLVCRARVDIRARVHFALRVPWVHIFTSTITCTITSYKYHDKYHCNNKCDCNCKYKYTYNLQLQIQLQSQNTFHKQIKSKLEITRTTTPYHAPLLVRYFMRCNSNKLQYHTKNT